MSITLNDEQEKALREWYEYSLRPKYPETQTKDLKLSRAIAPLMKPWSVEAKEDGVFVICGPRAKTLCFDEDTAHRICDLLNESEAKR